MQRGDAPEGIRIRNSGSANLSNGVWIRSPRQDRATDLLLDFFQQEAVPVNEGGPSRKSIIVEMNLVEALPDVPSGKKHGYHLRITPSEITIKAVSPHGMTSAIRVLKQLYRESKGEKKTFSFKEKKLMPCYQITGWSPEGGDGSFRITNNPFHPASELIDKTDAVVPQEFSQVELMLTEPDRGWLIPGEILLSVNGPAAIHSGDYYTYEDINRLIKRMENFQIELIPTFDLTAPNSRFEEVVGHRMLSVEGLRFIRALLDEFLNATICDTLNFIIPEGKYRALLEEIIQEYPQVTVVHFLDK